MSLSVDLEKRLGSFHLRVQFQAETETLALLGASGCGKSMTLKCIAGIMTPDRGRIVLNGRVLFDSEARIDLPPQQRRVGYLFQNYALFPHMTVAANIGYSLKLKKRPKDEIKKAVDDALALVQLSGYGKRMPAELSGGQRQRVFIAMILAQDAPVVLFDEPTSFLDVSACYEVMELMRSLKEKHGKTVVAVIHDINLALKYSDEVCVMRAGKLLAQGAPHEAEVLAAVEDAFDVRIELLHGELGSSYALWRRTKR